MTKFHGIFKQFVGNEGDRILDRCLSLSRVPVLTWKEGTEVVSEKISGQTVVAPALLDRDRGR